MQVKIHWIEFSNILSYGNAPTKVQLDDSNFTIITAKNGSGKSTILDAICYVLYGKPYRNIKLGQLINSTNKKALKVTIELSVGSDVYRVIRGQKPNIFEIYLNGELVPEDAASRDYQEYLESSVLKMNFKTFKQIVVIGSASYVPFMDLSPADRRKINDKVLDISVFSSMLDIAKAKVSEYKSLVDGVQYEIAIIKNSVDSQKELLETLKKEDETKQANIQSQRDVIKNRIDENTQLLEKLTNDLIELSSASDKYNALLSAKQKLDIKVDRINSKISDLTESKEFYASDNCPSCGQSIDESFKVEKCDHIDKSIESLVADRLSLDNIYENFNQKLKDIQEQVSAHTNLVLAIKNTKFSISRDTEQLVELTKTSVNTESIEICSSKLKSLLADLIQKTELKNEYSKHFEYYKASTELLKDNGIKAKIIAKFIPILNKLVNDNLAKFDMFVSFELDETFNETIKSRHRDTFTYNSFSEGEKKKIDLALLFAWREIAMSRNSVSINILIFDETLDSSMDSESVDVFVDILSSIEDGMHTLVISHRNVVPEIFDKHITIDKVRDFSILSVNGA